MAFNQKAIQAVIDGVHSLAAGLGAFERVLDYEPKSPPGQGLTLALWWDSITPLPAASGLAATTARVAFAAQVYRSYAMPSADESRIDPDLAGGVCALLAALAGSFTLAGQVMEVDLLGAYGEPLSAKTGYLELGGKFFRVAFIPVPVIVDDVWAEVP